MIRSIDILSRARLVNAIHKSDGKLLRDRGVRCITVHDKYREPAFSKKLTDRHLVLCFDDITPREQSFYRDYQDCRVAQPEDAEAVVAYAKQIHEDPQKVRLLVNCEAGISRSAAIATAIADICGVETVRAHQGEIRPNEHVRRLILHAARKAGMYNFPMGTSIIDAEDAYRVSRDKVVERVPFGRRGWDDDNPTWN